MRTVVLHDAGLPVIVPAPERYAIHRLLASTAEGRRTQKSDEDISLAGNIIEALGTVRMEGDLGLALFDAIDQGSSWVQRILRASLRLSDERLHVLRAAVVAAGQIDKRNPDETGLESGREGILRRLRGRSAGQHVETW